MPLKSQLIGPLPFKEPEKNVSSIISLSNGNPSWNLESFPFPIPLSLAQKNYGTALPLFPHGCHDSIYWNLTLDGIFLVKSAYNFLICKRNNNNNVSNYHWLWKAFCNTREIFFVWKAFNYGLPTSFSLHKRNIIPSPICPRCNSSVETTKHTLRDCLFSSNTWSKLHTPQNFYNDSFKDWVYCNTTNHSKNTLNIPWSTIFLFTLHRIWLARNNFLFKNKQLNPTLTAKLALEKAAEFWASSSFDHHYITPPTSFLQNSSTSSTPLHAGSPL